MQQINKTGRINPFAITSRPLKKLNPDNQVVGAHGTQILDIPAGPDYHADTDVPRGIILRLMPGEFVLFQEIEGTAVVADPQDQLVLLDQDPDIDRMGLSVVKAVLNDVDAQFLDTQP